MKRRSFIYLISMILLTAVSCEDKFHMPFKETDEGNDKVSLYMDGVAMRSFHERGYLGMAERTTFSWADVNAYVFKSWIGAEGADYGGNSILIDIRREFPEDIRSGVRYEVTPYSEPSNEEELELYFRAPHVWILINGYPATEGWVEFRSYTTGVASGNFEMDYIDAEGITHTIRYGNFDSAPDSFSNYNPSFF